MRKEIHSKHNSRAQLRIGIIGYGKMGQHHINTIRNITNADVAALADPFIDESSSSADAEMQIEQFSSYDKMIAQIKPDAVHICTPPHTHFKIAKHMIENGIDTYVEKPFTLKAEEAQTILDLAAKEGVNVCAGHQVLFDSAATETMGLLHLIGRINHIESYFSFHQVRKTSTAREQLVDIMPHPIYILLNFLNQANGGGWDQKVITDKITVNHDYDVHALVSMGKVSGLLTITLKGRPVESYLKIVGTNGTIVTDFVRGTVSILPGPGISVFSAILNPYSLARQFAVNTTVAFIRRALSKHKSYPGLAGLIEEFYQSIRNKTKAPVSKELIWNTVALSERINTRLNSIEKEVKRKNREELKKIEAKLVPVDKQKATILITGGTGFLGKKLVSDLRDMGWPVRVLTRKKPDESVVKPGVEYCISDLAAPLDGQLFKNVGCIIHCAAETAGNQEEHRKNTIVATENLLNGAIAAKISNFINISSIAVLKPGTDAKAKLSEQSPVDIDNLDRGPYVWAKSIAEDLVCQADEKGKIKGKTLRLGPLVDYDAYYPPGRLGREIGTTFFAVGSKKDRMSICTTATAVKVIIQYMQKFDEVPDLLNVVEPEAPTRKDLVLRLLNQRLELKSIWIPAFVLKTVSPLLIVLQRVLLSKKKPIDLYSAFSTEYYDTTLIRKVVENAN